MYIIESIFKINDYVIFTLDKVPQKEYKSFIINGEKYPAITVYDMPGSYAVKTKDGIKEGAIVELE